MRFPYLIRGPKIGSRRRVWWRLFLLFCAILRVCPRVWDIPGAGMDRKEGREPCHIEKRFSRYISRCLS